MPTFTTSREATKDEMAREIDRCHKVIVELEARAKMWEERAGRFDALAKKWEAEAHAHIERAQARIADLEARLARVPDREAVARALYPMLVHGGDYDEVPVDEAFTRPRYQHLAERANAAADAVLALFAALQETKP